MQLDRLLNNIYGNSGEAPAMEKTAEAALLSGLSKKKDENPYENMSLEELTKIAQELEQGGGAAAPAAAEPADENLEKVAFDMLGGQVMAHSMVHELGLIKVAVAQGKCRVCKTNAMDVEGSSICSKCAAE